MSRQAQIAFLAATFLAASSTVSIAQKSQPDNSTPAPCSVIPQPDPCGTKPGDNPKKPSATDKFPFPGEPASTNSPDALAPSAPGASSAPKISDSPAPNEPGKSASQKFPFPGEASKPDLSGAATSSSSSSSSSSDDGIPADTPDSAPGANPSNAGPALKDAGSSGDNPTPGRHILHRVNPPGTKLQTADEREAEDLDVAHFYMDQGDLAGAYLRGKDAVTTKPDDPEAHFLLAEIANKLNKREEAIAEYNACLKLDPTDKQARDSRKALTKLQQ